MYHRFYGLLEAPFELTLSPHSLFLTKRHREALSMLEYGLFSAKSVSVLIGEAGTGKTTLLAAALEAESCRNVRCVQLSNPSLTRDEFVEMLAERFALSERSRTSKTAMLQELEAVLREDRARGRIAALVVDEAQNLSDELLEEIRLLANIETPTTKLLPIVLAGQPELRNRLNRAGLRQLKQRITLRCELEPFTLQETGGYVVQRVSAAGGDAATLFTREAIYVLHDRSGGIPRTINVLADNALLTGFALNRRPVDSEIVLDVAHDFDLGGVKMTGTDEVVETESAAAATSEEADLTPDAVAPESLDDAHDSPAEVIDSRALFQSHSQPRRFSLFGKN